MSSVIGSIATTALPSKAAGVTPAPSLILRYASQMFKPDALITRSFPNQSRLRACIAGICLTCPADRFIWGDGFKQTLIALRVLSTISLLLMVVLLGCYLFLPKQATQRSFFKVGYVVSAIIFALAFEVGLDQQEGGQCYDNVTRADALHVPRCLVSGVLFVGGYLGVRLWALLWTIDMFLLLVFDVTTFRKKPWILILIGTLIPAGFAFGSIPWLRSDFGPVCYPGDKLSILIIMKIPVIVIDSLSVLIELAIAYHIVMALIRSKRQTGEDRAMEQAFKQTVRLLWRPLTFTLVSALGMIAFVRSFVPVKLIYDRTGLIVTDTGIVAWGDCLYKNGFNYNACPSLGEMIGPYAESMSPFMYAFVLSFWFFATAFRSDMLRAMTIKLQKPIATQAVSVAPSKSTVTTAGSIEKASTILSARDLSSPEIKHGWDRSDQQAGGFVESAGDGDANEVIPTPLASPVSGQHMSEQEQSFASRTVPASSRASLRLASLRRPSIESGVLPLSDRFPS